MKDENKEAQSGCLTLAIVGCVIIGFWHHSMLYVALILLIPRYVKYRKLKSEEARREAERQEWESRRQERVVELCDLLRKRDYPLFKDLLKRSYGVLLDDDLVKVQKAFIMVSETEGLKPEVCTDAIAAGRPCYTIKPKQRSSNSGKVKGQSMLITIMPSRQRCIFSIELLSWFLRDTVSSRFRIYLKLWSEEMKSGRSASSCAMSGLRFCYCVPMRLSSNM